jgi:hypothetical protein
MVTDAGDLYGPDLYGPALCDRIATTVTRTPSTVGASGPGAMDTLEVLMDVAETVLDIVVAVCGDGG